MKIGSLDFGPYLRTSSHPESPFPDENTQLPANVYGQKPPPVKVKVDEIDRLKKGFWQELQAVPRRGDLGIRSTRSTDPEIRISGWKRTKRMGLVSVCFMDQPFGFENILRLAFGIQKKILQKGLCRLLGLMAICSILNHSKQLKSTLPIFPE